MNNTKPNLCIVYDFQSEKEKRKKFYDKLSSPFLMEVMTEFLEKNPSPMKNKQALKEGMELMSAVYKQAYTEELKLVAQDYLKMYKEEYNK